MLTTRIRPKVTVKPLATRNSSAASEVPLIAWRIALVVTSLAPGLPLVRSSLQELLRLPGPELRHGRVGLHRHVGEHLAQHRMLDLLDLRDVDVLHGVVVLVEAQGAARCIDLRAAHGLQEGRPVLDLAADGLHGRRSEERRVGKECRSRGTRRASEDAYSRTV